VNNWKAILATMLIFGTGVVTGGLLVNFSLHSRVRNQPGKTVAAPALPGAIRIEFLKRVERELELRPQQREQIDKILAASQERNRRLMQPLMPQFRAEYESTSREIRAALDPAQAERFDELLKHQQRPMQEKRARDQRAKGTNSPGYLQMTNWQDAVSNTTPR
jgi:hypothetical protein